MRDVLNKIFVTSFFGWNNIKFLIKELVKIGSNKPSFFSKKRMESGVAFLVLQFGMLEILDYLISRESTPMSDFAIWAGIEAFICGYALNKIEEAKARKNNPNEGDNEK
jgi:hypothetical protein